MKEEKKRKKKRERRIISSHKKPADWQNAPAAKRTKQETWRDSPFGAHGELVNTKRNGICTEQNGAERKQSRLCKHGELPSLPSWVYGPDSLRFISVFFFSLSRCFRAVPYGSLRVRHVQETVFVSFCLHPPISWCVLSGSKVFHDCCLNVSTRH